MLSHVKPILGRISRQKEISLKNKIIRRFNVLHFLCIHGPLFPSYSHRPIYIPHFYSEYVSFQVLIADNTILIVFCVTSSGLSPYNFWIQDSDKGIELEKLFLIHLFEETELYISVHLTT